MRLTRESTPRTPSKGMRSIGKPKRTRLFLLFLTLATGGWHAILDDVSARAPSTPEDGLLYFVNTTSDVVVAGACANGNENCSLRGAIAAANSHPGPDGIDISLPPGAVIELTNALPDISDGVTITGSGAENLTVRSLRHFNHRIFNVTTSGVVTLSGMTISNGLAEFGAGIRNASSGHVVVTNCAITGNSALSLGGAGVYNGTSGTVTLTNSTLSGNGAANSSGGGAISNPSNGSVNVNNCTIRSNSAPAGGGIFNNGAGTVNVTNSTFHSNTSTSAGGGAIYASGGAVNVSNSTLSGNSAIGGGGIHTSGIGTVTVKSSIIARNSGGSTPDASGPITTGGFNLIGATDGGTGFTAATDQTGTNATPLDPKIDTAGLKNNGGPTQTLALLPTSPAIDKGTSAGITGPLATDQRGAGFPRTFNDQGIANASGGDGTDIGAFEVQTEAPTVLANISTRLRVETVDNVLIGGFIITGTQPKRVIIRALGPSLSVAGKLVNPTLELFGPGGLIASNDNWRSAQEAAIIASSVPPTNDLESAIVATLPANTSSYTAIVRGVSNGTGVGLVEIYDLDRAVDSQLANISTRGLVQTGDNVMIGGIILLGSPPRRVIVRAIGPSLPVNGKLADPTLELVNQHGVMIGSNDNWRTTQEAEIIATMVPPTNNLESAIVAFLAPAPHTAIVRGKNGTIGVALVEAFALP